MKIATYNVNGIKARLPRLLEWLEETTPDVACLQETKSVAEGVPVREIEAAGYHALLHGEKGFNGVAILTREKAQLVRTGLPGADELEDGKEDQARYIEADYKGVRIASIYLPNGNPQPGPKFDFKLRWMERLRLHASELWTLEKPTVLTGDFNIAPQDRDVFSMAAMGDDALVQPESRAAWQAILSQGWLEALRAVHPLDDELYTFWDYQAGAWPRNAGLRIDHHLLSPAIADRLLDAKVDKDYRGREKSSDHTPVWIEIA
ncbi:MAG: exodeoxyribonuclease III [Pacificimonas sp.]